MSIFGVSLLGVLAATFTGMLLGALWYSPLAFGKQWMESIGKTPEQLGNQLIPMLGSVLASFITAVGVSLIFLWLGVDSLAMGIHIGIVLGLFIVFPALLSDNLFCGWGIKLLLIQTGYRVLSIFLMSIVLVYVA